MKPKEEQSIPSELTNLSEHLASTNNQSNYDSPIKDFDKHGYELSCEIFLKDIVYPNKVFGNFIVQAAAPCWFYDDGQIYDDNRLSSVDIPIVIEHVSEQRWYTITTYQFIPIFTNMNKELAVQSFSQFAFTRPPEESSSAIIIIISSWSQNGPLVAPAATNKKELYA